MDHRKVVSVCLNKEHQDLILTVFQVLEWPSPVRAGKGPVEGPSINSVAMDPDLRYLVALTDKNMAVVWRREKTEKDV